MIPLKTSLTLSYITWWFSPLDMPNSDGRQETAFFPLCVFCFSLTSDKHRRRRNEWLVSSFVLGPAALLMSLCVSLWLTFPCLTARRCDYEASQESGLFWLLWFPCQSSALSQLPVLWCIILPSDGCDLALISDTETLQWLSLPTGLNYCLTFPPPPPNDVLLGWLLVE